MSCALAYVPSAHPPYRDLRTCICLPVRQSVSSPIPSQGQTTCFCSLLLPFSSLFTQLPPTPGTLGAPPTPHPPGSPQSCLTSQGPQGRRKATWFAIFTPGIPDLLLASCHLMSSSASVCPSSTLSRTLLQPTGHVWTRLISQKNIVMFNKLPSKSNLSTPT